MVTEGNGSGPEDAIVCDSPAMASVMDTLRRVAPTDATVLLTGESGTGKSLLARHLHRLGPRRAGPFIGISCANVSEGLLESELFGHERGAFTGAEGQKAGKFELANGGTLFIDSVGDLEPGLQAKLLRVLQERRVERLGGSGAIPIDVRIVASALDDLDRRIRAERFRKDLYYRLNVVRIALPPLRDRREDLPRLAERFLQEVAAQHGRRCRWTGAALERLRRHRWPGNLRELRNVVERAVIATDGERIGPEAIRLAGPAGPGQVLERAVEERMPLAELESLYIQEILRSTGGNQSAAARILGMHRKTLLEKRKKYGISGDGERRDGA
ncbi:MAG: sigma-54-dependent Fis family transcriptional regulator [Acidobacteria bacterium]|nr:sigma-54-dependent Fis family transcriptional regulator [Acidobacteriota bacterium]